MDAIEISAIVLGWIILICVCCYSIPQLLTVVKTKNTKGLSIAAYIFFIFSNVCMLCWGIGNSIRGVVEEHWPAWHVILILLPNVVMNSLNTSINITCLSLKIKHVRLAKKKGIDETELSKILLKQAKQKKSRKVGK